MEDVSTKERDWQNELKTLFIFFNGGGRNERGCWLSQGRDGAQRG